jgi:hypothetical protein
MSNSTSDSPFSFEEFNKLITGIEMLYAIARKLSGAIENQTCEYLIQEATMAFVKSAIMGIILSGSSGV